MLLKFCTKEWSTTYSSRDKTEFWAGRASVSRHRNSGRIQEKITEKPSLLKNTFSFFINLKAFYINRDLPCSYLLLEVEEHYFKISLTQVGISWIKKRRPCVDLAFISISPANTLLSHGRINNQTLKWVRVWGVALFVCLELTEGQHRKKNSLALQK